MAQGSTYLQEAQEILERVRGKPATLGERKKLAVQLAGLMLNEASAGMTWQEQLIQGQLARLMQDPVGKAFTTSMTDECFRSKSHYRVADQMIYLLHKLGVPRYLNMLKRLQLMAFKMIGVHIAQFLVPIAMLSLRKETDRVILPGEPAALLRHLKERKKEGVRQNLNHLGEAILSEAEAAHRLETYLSDLQNPEINYISVKISTIFSQINLLDRDGTVDHIANKLRTLYQAAIQHEPNKFINLDMEEYRDLDLTVAAFQKVLEESDFTKMPAGIVLQAYLPDSHEIQKKLTEWAQIRVKEGGAPIKIRIVKGANLAMEQFEASLKGWPQAPYTRKIDVDANYKRMVLYGMVPEHARAVHLGVASHNLFDIAFAMLLRAENQVEPYIVFEMLEGMADHIRRVVQKLSGDILLYCPIATKEEFQHAIAYLIRRLDENTGPENFLRHSFGLKPGSAHWDQQVAFFEQSCDLMEKVGSTPRRTQNRQLHVEAPDLKGAFENEPDTDFALTANRIWGEEITRTWKGKKIQHVPLVIGGREVTEGGKGTAFSPNAPDQTLYTYTKADKQQLDEALKCAKAHEKEWASTTVEHRSSLLARAAQKMRERRGEFLGVMMIDGGKTLLEGDPEVSEAIDMAEYYRRCVERMATMEDLRVKPKGTVLVTPPWNFPLAIPAGGVLAALMAGNCVLLKPASDAVLVAWHLVNSLWDAGISREVLQFIPCSGEEAGSLLIADPRVNAVILTGGTETAKKFLKMRPGLDLSAETGGKNAMIVTALSDRDLAVKDILQGAFGHAGQKCSATSLVILEREVYEDQHFLDILREAAASLHVGPSWHLDAKMGPLIHPARGDLLRGLTTLEPGEEWLLQPKQDPANPCLWTPGIKLHVKPGSFTHMTELFGPVLGLMCADSLHHAVQLANQVPYGLTSGLHSLDERERHYWAQHIEAGNLYINRGTTGAIVRRQPFGGTKASSIGNGSKAGGPNYLRDFVTLEQHDLPHEKHPVSEVVNNLTALLPKLSSKELALWYASTTNYAYWWEQMRHDQDPSQIVGQDNLFRYVPRKRVVLRATGKSLDALRVIAAALTCQAHLELSVDPGHPWAQLTPHLRCTEESEETFLRRVREGAFTRVRVVEHPSQKLLEAAAEAATHVADSPVLANGRFELLHYLREVSLSIDYHRYGNLGLRESEKRKPIL